MSESQYIEFQQGTSVASKDFESLVDLSDADLNDLWKRAFTLRCAVSKCLLGVTDSQNRISENYAMLIAATELVCFLLWFNRSTANFFQTHPAGKNTGQFTFMI